MIGEDENIENLPEELKWMNISDDPTFADDENIKLKLNYKFPYKYTLQIGSLMGRFSKYLENCLNTESKSGIFPKDDDPLQWFLFMMEVQYLYSRFFTKQNLTVNRFSTRLSYAYNPKLREMLAGLLDELKTIKEDKKTKESYEDLYTMLDNFLTDHDEINDDEWQKIGSRGNIEEQIIKKVKAVFRKLKKASENNTPDQIALTELDTKYKAFHSEVEKIRSPIEHFYRSHFLIMATDKEDVRIFNKEPWKNPEEIPDLKILKYEKVKAHEAHIGGKCRIDMKIPEEVKDEIDGGWDIAYKDPEFRAAVDGLTLNDSAKKDMFHHALCRIKKRFLFRQIHNAGIVSRVAYLSVFKKIEKQIPGILQDLKKQKTSTKREEFRKKTLEDAAKTKFDQDLKGDLADKFDHLSPIINAGQEGFRNMMLGFMSFKVVDDSILEKLIAPSTDSNFTDEDIVNFITRAKLSKAIKEVSYKDYQNRVRAIRNRYDEYSLKKSDKDSPPEFNANHKLGRLFNRKAFRKMSRYNYQKVRRIVAENCKGDDLNDVFPLLYRLNEQRIIPLLFFKDYAKSNIDIFGDENPDLIKEITKALNKAGGTDADKAFFSVYKENQFVDDNSKGITVKILKYLVLLHFNKYLDQFLKRKKLLGIKNPSDTDKKRIKKTKNVMDHHVSMLNKALRIIEISSHQIPERANNDDAQKDSEDDSEKENDNIVDYLDNIPIIIPAPKYMKAMSEPIAECLVNSEKNRKNLKKIFTSHNYTSYKDIIEEMLRYRVALHITDSVSILDDIDDTFNPIVSRIFNKGIFALESIEFDKNSRAEEKAEIPSGIKREVFNPEKMKKFLPSMNLKKKMQPFILHNSLKTIGDVMKAGHCSPDVFEQLKDQKDEIGIEFRLKSLKWGQKVGAQPDQTDAQQEIEKMLVAAGFTDKDDKEELKVLKNRFKLKDTAFNFKNYQIGNLLSKKLIQHETRIAKLKAKKTEITKEIKTNLQILDTIRNCEDVVYDIRRLDSEGEFKPQHWAFLKDKLEDALKSLTQKDSSILSEARLKVFTDKIIEKEHSDIKNNTKDILTDINSYLKQVKHRFQGYNRPKYVERRRINEVIASLHEVIASLHKEQSQPRNDRTKYRNAYKKAIEILFNEKKFEKFNKYFKGELPDNPPTAIIKLSKNLQRKIIQGSSVETIQILNPKYPSRNCVANVYLKSDSSIANPVPPFLTGNVKFLKNEVRPGAEVCMRSASQQVKDQIAAVRSLRNAIRPLVEKKGIVLGLDDNRLNCFFTFAYGLLTMEEITEFLTIKARMKEKKETEEDLTRLKEDLKRLEELKGSMYKDLNDYIKIVDKKHKSNDSDDGEDANQRNSVKITKRELELLVLGCAGIEPLENKNQVHPFFKKLENYVLGLGTKKDGYLINQLIRPVAEHPDDLEGDIDTNDSSRFTPGFTDYLMAPIKYRAVKRNHLSRHIIGISRLNKNDLKSLGKKFGAPLNLTKDDEQKILRRKTDKHSYWESFTNLRFSIRNYLLRSLALITRVFEPYRISYETLNFQTGGQSGFLSLIVQGMFDDISDVFAIIGKWMDATNRYFESDYQLQKGSVGASFTSMFAFQEKILHDLSTEFSKIDRSSSYDYSLLRKKPKIEIDDDEKIIDIISKRRMVTAHNEAGATIGWKLGKDLVSSWKKTASNTNVIRYLSSGEG